MTAEPYLYAAWPAPKNIVALSTYRGAGVSAGTYASANYGDHVGDSATAVAHNRAQLQRDCALPAVSWLNQVHGNQVVMAQSYSVQTADAVISKTPGLACAVLTADCLPVLLCDRAGTVVAAVHCGWRSLSTDILRITIEAMACPPCELIAWLGPAIGPTAFEVGEDVVQAFERMSWFDTAAFQRAKQAADDNSDNKYMADIYALASASLQAAGVDAIFGGGCCTLTQAEKFYSFRRDGVTGRMASLIYLK